MYKALIVDDERIIRDGIRRMIPWERISVDEVFTAGSGKAALEIVRKNRPDILLTDIQMTEMDGLSLIGMVNELHPAMRVIVLTGYDNFEYVQQCCRMNVQDFILKPADEEALTRVVRAQTEELDRLRGIERYQKVMSRAQSMAEQMQLEQALRGLLSGSPLPEAVSQLLEGYQYRPDRPLQAAIIVPTPECDAQWRDHDSLLAISVKNTCMELFDSACEGITFEDGEGRIVLALFTGGALDETMERMEKLSGLLRNEFAFTPMITIGSSVSGLGGLAASYTDAMLLLSDSGPNREVVQTGSAERRLKIFGDAFSEFKQTITSGFGNPDKIMRAFTAFTAAANSYNLSVSMVRRCCFEIACSMYYNHISDTGETVDNKLTALLSSLMVCSREEICKFTGSFLTQLLGDEDAKSHELVSEARRYIAENLAEELSVSSIAARMYVTPNYFSRLFKRVMGEGCNEYIVRKRMEMAKSLLVTTDFKTGKIAGMAGYRDTNYFSLAFKKYSGFSPTAYRSAAR